MTDSTLNDFVNIPEAARRARSEGIPVSEYAIRYWVKIGALPARKIGRQMVLFFPNLVQYLKCEDGADNVLLRDSGESNFLRVNAAKGIANLEIRVKAKNCGVRHWQIAESLGIQESKFSKILRGELPAQDKARIMDIIDEIVKELKAV